MGILILVILSIIFYAIYKSSQPTVNKYVDVPIGIQVSTNFGYEDEIDETICADDVWVPKNKPITIKNITLNNGMIYVGSGLACVDNNYDIEPSLIDPKLSIKRTDEEPDRIDLGYWPSYKRQSPEARYTYLKWLEEGRKNPSVEIGFVFMFFYGLERRLLSDTKTSETARTEALSIINEVERLLKIYNQNASFNGYATKFLDFARIKFTPNKITVEVPKEQTYGEIPLSMRVGLSYYCAKGKPIPPSWALYWYKNYPYYRTLRTPAERCQKEFFDLYEKRYYENLKEGLIIPEPKKRLELSYRPASNSFHTTQCVKLTSLPDVIHLSKPLKIIEEVVESTIDELDAYSRYLGRNPHDKNSLIALSFLPKGIDIRKYNDRISDLDAFIKAGIGERSGAFLLSKKLLKFYSFKSEKKISKNENIAVINSLDRLGYAIEPDIRFSNIKIDPAGKIVIFKKPQDSPDSPTKEYQATSLILTLATAVSTADGEVSNEEKKYLTNHIQSALGLAKTERIRLSALFNYLLIEPPRLSTLRKRIDEFSELQRRSIAQFLISIANADNKIVSDEIKILKKIYKFLGFDPESIYSDIHKAQTTYAQEPAVIKSSKYDSSQEYKIPERKNTTEKTLVLDEEKINYILVNTKKAVDILAPLFQENDESIKEVKAEKPEIQQDNIATLDAVHSAIVRELLERDIYPRSEFEELCSKFGLLPDGVIETINESFFESCDDALIEDEDDLVINKEAVKEIHND